LSQKVSKNPKIYCIHSSLPKNAKSRFGFLGPLGVKLLEVKSLPPPGCEFPLTRSYMYKFLDEHDMWSLVEKYPKETRVLEKHNTREVYENKMK
jgi:hypothetical protein